MSLLRKGFVGLLTVAAIALLGGFVLPSQVHIERQTTIDAPADQIFAEVSDFHNWDDWLPWAKLDPNARLVITGEGTGQIMSWESENPEVGSGTQQVTQLESPRLVKSHLDFGDRGVSDATFTLEPSNEASDEATLVTWSLDTDMREGVPMVKQPVSTYFGFLMDSIVGDQYEQGLANLKAVVEE